MLDKFIDGAFKTAMTIVLSGIAAAAIMVMVKWLIDIGFFWSCIVIGIVYLLYKFGKSGKTN